MKYNPKVVSFDRSAAYVHHRAMKNMRNNNPVDALELMRSAVEHSPDNREYWLDLAEMYCEMGCHEQSNRILLDMIAQRYAPAECYYGLALNQFGRNEMESAKQALVLYRRYAKNGEYLEAADGLRAEIDYYEAMRRPLDRKRGRAVQLVNRACDALKADEPLKACRLFEESFARFPDQPEMRALYAMALRLAGDEEAALALAESLVDAENASIRTLCVAGQVIFQCGQREKGQESVMRAMAQKPFGPELRLLIFALSEMALHAEAAEAAKRALREEPHDKQLLHMRAVALHFSGVEDALTADFWLRILRIDPEDSVAAFYYAAASEGRLSEVQPCYVYEVLGDEYRRRLKEIMDQLNQGMEKCIERWTADAAFRQMLIWAVRTGEESCGRAAVMVIAAAGDECSESILRELFYSGDVPVSVKIHAMVFLRLRGADVDKLMPPGMNAQDGMLPKAETLLAELPVYERQLVRFAAEIVEQEYGLCASSALALMWRVYRASGVLNEELLACTQEAAAALAWNYLLDHGVKLSVDRLAAQFGCRRRRMVFYARQMAAALEKQGRILEDNADEHEDH